MSKSIPAKRQNFNITPEQEAQIEWLKDAIGAPNTKETILRSIEIVLALKQQIQPNTKLFLHTPEGQIRLVIPELEADLSNDRWQYLVSRPHPWRRQLYVKGHKLLASTVWQDAVSNHMTSQETAKNWQISLTAVAEIFLYCEQNRELIQLEAEEEFTRLVAEEVRVETQTTN